MQRTSQEQGTSRAAFLKGVHSDTFEIRFTLVDHTTGLAFAGLDGYNCIMVKLSRDKDSPVPFAMREGVLSSSGLTGTYTAANYKFIAAGTPRPFKVTYDGTTLSVFTGANRWASERWNCACIWNAVGLFDK